MPADLSRFRTVREWIVIPVGRRMLAVSLNRRFKPLSQGSESQEPVLGRRSRPRSVQFSPGFH